MARAPEHIPRLLALVRALARSRELPLSTLCEQLGIEEKELREDIELLSMCGLPPYGPDSLIDIQIVRDRVRLSNKVLSPPPLQLTDEEAAGLRVTLRLAEEQGWPERRALKSAVRKLEAALLPERREGARRLAKRMTVAGGEGPEVRWLPLVRKAIETKTSLDATYYSDGREELTARRIDPYRLVSLARGRYVIAWCHLRKAILTFRLDRFVRVRRTAHRFEPPAELRISDYVGDTPRDAGSMVAVTVRFSPGAAHLARETWPAAKPTPDGGALLKVKVWANLAFCREIARWGGEAEVLSPDTVRAQVRDYAKARLRRYGGAEG